MQLKFFYILSFLFLSNHFFSQKDLQKQLLANKWYVSGGFLGKSMFFSPNPINKPETWEANFLQNGKMKRCDSIRGSLFDKEGKERKLTLIECDSTGKYQISNGIIHITGGMNHYYFKPKATPDKGFEFVQAKAEDFYGK